MIEDAKKMRCGACGGDTFRMYKEPKGLISECLKCKSTSTIRVRAPEIEIDWGEQSDGILCVF